MKTIVYTLLILVLISCNSKASKHKNQESLVFDKEKVEKEIRQMFNAYFNDMNTKGLSSEFKYLDSSKDFFWVPPGFTKHLTFKEVEPIIRKNAALMKNMKNEFESLTVFPISNELATYTGIVVAQYDDTTNITHNYKLIESGTLIKREDGWKLLSGQSRQLSKD